MLEESQSKENKDRITLLIDAENVGYNKIDNVISELANLGIIKQKVAYANWQKQNLKNWEDVITKHSIQAIQQFDYTKGKNASDIKLVIDAMKMLYTKSTDAFCIVASDSDYAPLIQEIRTHDLPVYGFGDQKTPPAFINACNKFFYFEKSTKISTKDLDLLKTAVKATSKDGWSDLSTIGQHLNNSSSFEIKNYTTTLIKLFQSLDNFKITRKGTNKSAVYIQLKRK